MKREQHWYEYITLNGYQLGLSMASNVISPLLLPALVLVFMPPEKKNTYTALVYVAGLAVAMFIQPVMGMLSDQCTSRMGRRRPFILLGALLNILFLGVVGASLFFKGSPLDSFFQTSFGVTASLAVLLLGILLLQFSSNISQATNGWEEAPATPMPAKNSALPLARSPGAIHSATALLQFGRAAASPTPTRKRIQKAPTSSANGIPATAGATAVSAVNTDHQVTAKASNRRGP